MTTPYVIAVDSGKNRTKAVRIKDGVIKEKDRFSIQTRLEQTNEVRSKTTRTSVVTMDGISTLIGSETARPSLDSSKKLEVHKRATYLSISKLAPNGSSIELGIGTPIDYFLSDQKTKSYQQFMLGLEENEEDNIDFPVQIKFDVDDVSFTYTIVGLSVFPETSGHIMKNDEAYRGQEIVIVDIGGLNANLALYTPVDITDPNSDIDMSDGEGVKFTLDEGAHYFSSRLQRRLNKELDLKLTNRDMTAIILQGEISKEEFREASIPIILSEKEEYIEIILSKMEEAQWSVRTMSVVFIGGGAILLKDQILKTPEFTGAIIPERPEWENVEGFALSAEAISADEYA